MSLGTRIRECRQRARLSQEKVAELVGVSRQAVTKWESDQSAPNTENLFRLAEVLGTTVDFLITSEADNRSVAEQVYQMFKVDEARKQAELLRQKHLNLYAVLAVLAGYAAIYLTGKLLLWDRSDTALFPWLIDQRNPEHSYLFGWLLSSGMFKYSIFFTMLPALAGLRRIAYTALAGFALALPLGEWLGSLPFLVAEGYHYGWAIWGGIFIGSWVMGFWLQKMPQEELHFRSRKMKIWCAVFAALIIAVIVLTLLSVPAYARPAS